jgi:hypothetical protein
VLIHRKLECRLTDHSTQDFMQDAIDRPTLTDISPVPPLTRDEACGLAAKDERWCRDNPHQAAILLRRASISLTSGRNYGGRDGE